MPTYEFYCNNCKSSFEKWFSMNEQHNAQCPNCGSDKVKKVFSTGAGIVFKGSGFYTTDYKKKEKTESCCSSESNCNCQKGNENK